MGHVKDINKIIEITVNRVFGKHAHTHHHGGYDELEVEKLASGTEEEDVVLMPTADGGVEWVTLEVEPSDSTENVVFMDDFFVFNAEILQPMV